MKFKYMKKTKKDCDMLLKLGVFHIYLFIKWDMSLLYKDILFSLDENI